MAENDEIAAATDSDDLYIGYLYFAPPGIAVLMRRLIPLLLLLAVLVALPLVLAQKRWPAAVYESQITREFTGVVREKPYPTLQVRRPGSAESSRFYLVSPGKLGAAAEVAGLDGRWVKLQGSLLYRDDQTMIELLPGTIEQAKPPVAGASAPKDTGLSLGVHTMVGRIVDSKCYLGLMKPGRGKPHRACAVRCISGGIPPLFVVSDERGPAAYLLLVGADGRAVNGEVLRMVDEPLEIRGEVVRLDDVLVLKAEPATYRRLL